MTIFDGIILIVLLGSLGVLGFIVWRKAPQLSIVDPSSSREKKTRETKRAILEERMIRQVEEQGKDVLRRSLFPFIKTVQEGFRRLAGRLTALERRYVERQRTEKIDATQLQEMLDEGKAFIAEERYDLAEKTFIAVLSHDAKNVDAYELLGRMYLSQKQYPEARELLQFLLKFSPNDASVLVAVGEVFEAEGNMKKALEYYGKAKAIRPNNPKYLDFFIHASLAVGDTYEAQRAIDHLREVNPENKKIEEFEEHIAEQKKK